MRAPPTRAPPSLSKQRTNDLARDDGALNVCRREPWVADLILAQLAIWSGPRRGMQA